MKHLLRFVRTVLPLATCCFYTNAFSQGLAFVNDLNPHEIEQEHKIALTFILKDLEEKYDVHFSYASDVVKNQFVFSEVPDSDEVDIKTILTDILSPLDLDFRKVRENAYLIFKSRNEDIKKLDSKTATLSAGLKMVPLEMKRGMNTERSSIFSILEKTITGTVTDENNEGLPGVNILVKGTTAGTVTDVEGNYRLTAPDDAQTLVFSSVGYQTQEIEIGTQTVINIQLAPDIQALSEVVVIGYGSQKRSDITGSVAVVDVEKVQQAQAASVGEQLQGRVPGVSVTSTGLPGQTPEVKIRGTGIFGNNNPLYVIDGLLTSNSADFNPNDVESIQVLKDAAATALYGTQAANGVIVITTKRGKEGPPKVSFSGYYGVQEIANRLELMNAEEFAAVTNAAYDAAGIPRMPGTSTKFDPSIDTDWQDAFFKTGAIQNYNLTISGGSANANYLVSGDFFDQEGTVIGPSFRRYNLRVNTGLERGKFRFGESLLLSRSNRVDMIGRPFNDVIRMLPTIPVRTDDAVNFPGGYGFGSQDNYTFGSNPIAMQELTDNAHISSRLQGTVYGEYDITDFLTYKLNLGLEYQSFYDKFFRKFGIWSYNSPIEPPFLEEGRGEQYSTLVENTLTFDQSFGDHNLNVLAGYVEQQIHFRNTVAINRGYTADENGNYRQVLSAGTQDPSVRGIEWNQALRSFLGRVTYDYAGRYYFTVSIRRDGVSRFASDHKWGNFPAGSIGWRISNEGFFQNAPAWIDNLMLRASYGVTGNSNTDLLDQPAASYPYLAVINTSTNYVFGTGQTITSGASQQQLVNDDIRWQSKRATDIGFDLTLFENRISVTADYYETLTTGLLAQVPLPGTSGNDGGDPYVNNGEMRNRGVEVGVTYQETKKAFQYSISANATTVKNKILALAFDRPIYGPGSTRTAVGGELGQFFLIQRDGIFQNEEEILNSAQPDAQPGDVRFKDVNGRDAEGNLTGQPDGKIDNDDRAYVGSSIPKLEYGLNLTASYKGFDFTAFFMGVYGNKIFNTGKWWGHRTDDNQNHPKDLVPWTPENMSNTTPRAVFSTGGVSNARYNQDAWLESGTYFRLRTMQIGYTLPASIFGNLGGLQDANLRVYVNGQNLFTITKYSGFNPEVRGEGLFGRGVDDGNYPTSRVITGGIQFNF